MTRASAPAAWSMDVIDDCSDISGWTKVNSSAGARDAEESTAYALNGAQSFRFWDTTRASNIMLEKAISHSFAADDRLCLVYYVASIGSTDTGIGPMTQGSDNATFASGNRWQRLPLYQSTIGWQVMPIEFADTTVAGGSPLRTSAYVGMRIGLQSHASFDREIYLDSVVRVRSKPTLMISIDDGDETGYTEAHAYADANGVRLTFFIDGKVIGNSGFLTTANVQAMIAAGDCVGAHANEVGAWETPENIRTDWDACAQITGIATRFGSYPNGRYGQVSGVVDEVYAALAAYGASGVRTIGSSPLCPGAYSPYYIAGGLSLNNGTSLATAKAHIDKCVKHGISPNFYAHQFGAAADSTTWTIADWQALIDYAVAYRNQGLLRTDKTIATWHAEAQRGTLLRAA